MKTLRNELIHIVIVLFAVLSCQPVSKEDNPWKTLFNGTDLDGWQVIGKTGIVRVLDSTITCNMIRKTSTHTFVATREKYSDFILEMDIKIDTMYNSGIIIRSFDAPDNCDTCHVSLYGYQIKLDPSLTRKWSGGIFYDYGKTWHWLYDLENDERAKNAYKVGFYNRFRVEAIGRSIKVWVNGIPVTNMLNDDIKQGYIAIKIHSLKQDDPDKEKLRGRFKNIRVIDEDPAKHATSMDIPAIEVH